MERKFVKLYPHNTDEEVAKILKMPYSMVQRKAEELGLKKEEPSKREWTAEELKYISKVYADTPNEILAEQFGCDKWQVEHVAYRIELRKDKSYFNVSDDDNDLIKQWTKQHHEGGYNCSLGHFLTYNCLKHIFPYQKIEEEVPVGRLWVDILLPHLNIAVEVHGNQHSEFNPFFHKTIQDFSKGQENDWQKSEMLESQNISLFVVYHDEKISINLIKKKLEEII
jgi:hypothetical protein